ncbi:MAG: hypothetical protein MUC76_14100 [Spirochaetes bacterium]|nr:hypothetical protein [Spirochaetota bacterium]
MRIHPIALTVLIILAAALDPVHPAERTAVAIVTAQSKAVEADTMDRAVKAFRAVFAADEGVSLVDTAALDNAAGRLIREERDSPGKLSGLLRATGASKALVFTLEAHDGRHTASARVLDIAASAFEYHTGETAESAAGAADAAAVLAGRVALHLSGRLDWIVGLTAGDGEQAAGVRLSWASAKAADGERYVVYRSTRETGDFDRVAEVAGTEHLDAGALPGVRYWYRVRGSYARTLTDFSEPEAGHRKPALPAGLDIDRVLKQKTFAPPRLTLAAEREKAARDEEIMKPLYRHPVKLNLILLVARSYIKRGDVLVLRDFEGHTADTGNNTLTLDGPASAYSIGFKSKRLFRFREKAGDELFERLLANALFYCVPVGERETTLPDGTVVFTPLLEAIALSMEYHKNDRNWRERTIMFDTDVKEVREKIEKAGQVSR